MFVAKTYNKSLTKIFAYDLVIVLTNQYVTSVRQSIRHVGFFITELESSYSIRSRLRPLQSSLIIEVFIIVSIARPQSNSRRFFIVVNPMSLHHRRTILNKSLVLRQYFNPLARRADPYKHSHISSRNHSHINTPLSYSPLNVLGSAPSNSIETPLARQGMYKYREKTYLRIPEALHQPTQRSKMKIHPRNNQRPNAD